MMPAENYLELLTGLLEQYSPSGDELCAAGYFTTALQQMGFTAQIDPAGNAVGVLGDGPREILLLGHIDTVPGWIPIRRDGDRLFGRGAVDAKGPLACFAAAAALAGVRPGWRLRVVGAVGEEADSRGARYLIRTAAPPEYVIIGEPCAWDRIGLGYKGGLWLRCRVRQNGRHGAARVGSACDAALAFWNRVLALAADYNLDKPREFDRIHPSLSGMASAADGLVETAELTLDIRLPPGIAPRDLLQQIAALLPGSRAASQTAGVPEAAGELQVLSALPAYRAEKNTAPVRALLAALRLHGGTPGFTVKTGTSDMNLVGPAWGCPVVAYGPGDSSLDHTPDEHILVSEYLKSIKVMASALARMMETQPVEKSSRLQIS